MSAFTWSTGASNAAMRTSVSPGTATCVSARAASGPGVSRVMIESGCRSFRRWIRAPGSGTSRRSDPACRRPPRRAWRRGRPRGRAGRQRRVAFVDATRRRVGMPSTEPGGLAGRRRRLLHRRRHDVRFPESAEVWTEPLTLSPKQPRFPLPAHASGTPRASLSPASRAWCADSRDGLKGSAGPAKSRPSRFAGGDCACDLSLMTGEKRTLGASRIVLST